MVESYAGMEAEEYPLRFTVNGRQIEIKTIEKRWQTPACKYFKVLGDDGYTYVLEYNGDNDTWNLLTLNKP
ncbi:MAG: hypothetical protein ACWGN1_07330 [Desulfobulbales bacterium]